MNQSSPSNTGSEHPRPWLEKYYQARRQRTIDLVKATVDRLLKEGKMVTLEAICTLSREMDPAGKGIKKAGVLGNAEAHAYYRKHSNTYQRGLGYQRRKGRNKRLSAQPSRIDADRDVDLVRQRYLLQPKADLVERLISVEQAYATCQQQLEDAKRNAQQQIQKEGRARVLE